MVIPAKVVHGVVRWKLRHKFVMYWVIGMFIENEGTTLKKNMRFTA